ncbi:MAG: hypothetical protein KKF88_13605 [Alphaproteobacteria bacterium]|nr:hypothetical protein [Alphaproteobacteria bacterium]
MRLAVTLATAALAAATVGVSAPRAQEAPVVSGPYYLIDITRDALIVAAGGTVEKSGNMASVTVITGSSPETLAETGFGRLDMRYQFNCRNATYRTPSFAGYGAGGDLMGALTDDADWEAVNPDAPSATIMALACNGTIPADSLLEGDVQAIVTQYREFIVTQ